MEDGRITMKTEDGYATTAGLPGVASGSLTVGSLGPDRRVSAIPERFRSATAPTRGSAVPHELRSTTDARADAEPAQPDREVSA
jgi:hypothetical protein